MTTYIALLRAINLAGRNQVGMADLRDMLSRMGLANARSLLQSGNVLFQSRPRTTSQLERLLEAELRKRLSVDTDFMVRTADELNEAVAGNPFPKEAARDPGHLLLLFLKDAPSAASVKALQSAILGREIVRADGRHAYIVYPDGVGRSRLSSALIENKLGTRGTGRNWNTVLKLHALAGSSK
jgi:uncharacterized protein (DUF1697 family)